MIAFSSNCTYPLSMTLMQAAQGQHRHPACHHVHGWLQHDQRVVWCVNMLRSLLFQWRSARACNHLNEATSRGRDTE